MPETIAYNFHLANELIQYNLNYIDENIITKNALKLIQSNLKTR